MRVPELMVSAILLYGTSGGCSAGTPEDPVDASRGDTGIADTGPAVPDSATFVPPDADFPIERARTTYDCGVPSEDIDICPEAPIVHVSPTGRAGARGTPDDPFNDLNEAFYATACSEDGCEIRIAAGRYEILEHADGVGLLSRSCLEIIGGWNTDDPIAWSLGGEPSILVAPSVTAITATGRLRIERARIQDARTAISTAWGATPVFLRDVQIEASDVAHSSGITISWRSHDIAICRSTISMEGPGSQGIVISWNTDDTVVEGCTVRADLPVMFTAESARLELRRTTVQGGYGGVQISGNAREIVISDSMITSDGPAVDEGGGTGRGLIEHTSLRTCASPPIAVTEDPGWPHTQFQLRDVTFECPSD